MAGPRGQPWIAFRSPWAPRTPRPLPQPEWLKEKPPLPKTVRVVIAPLDGQKDSRLYLPRELWRSLNTDPAPVKAAAAPGRTSTIAAGLALTGAFVLGGLWLVKNPKRRLAGAVTVALAGLAVLGVCGCPIDKKPETQVAFRPLAPTHVLNGELEGEALLELDDSSDAVQLLLDRKALEQFAAEAAQPRREENRP